MGDGSELFSETRVGTKKKAHILLAVLVLLAVALAADRTYNSFLRGQNTVFDFPRPIIASRFIDVYSHELKPKEGIMAEVIIGITILKAKSDPRAERRLQELREKLNDMGWSDVRDPRGHESGFYLDTSALNNVSKVISYLQELSDSEGNPFLLPGDKVSMRVLGPQGGKAHYVVPEKRMESLVAYPLSAHVVGFEERFFRFPQGSQWIFDSDFAGGKRKVVITLSEERANLSYIEYDVYNPPDPGATASVDEAWYVENGFIVWGSYDELEGKTDPYWRIFKIGAKPGDSWESLPGIGQAKFVGLVEVIVPAGSFRNVALVTLTDTDGKEHAFYYAAECGLIRWDTQGPRGNVRLKLREFLPGKEGKIRPGATPMAEPSGMSEAVPSQSEIRQTSSPEAEKPANGQVASQGNAQKQKSAKERLIELRELYDKGLISENEYNKKRKEIIDTL